MNINLSNTDFDSSIRAPPRRLVVGAFRYLMGCKLLNYPGQAGARGEAAAAGGPPDFPVISKGGNAYTFTVKKRRRCKFNDRRGGDGASFADAINRDLNPTMTSPAVSSCLTSSAPMPSPTARRPRVRASRPAATSW